MVRVVDGPANEEQNMLQHNQVEEFEILDQATNSNVLAAQESRLVGRLWADDEMPDEEIEISDQPAYTKGIVVFSINSMVEGNGYAKLIQTMPSTMHQSLENLDSSFK
ncbi:unnamed protein product [Lupinus luteus]|uniref:Uncharacterized protein n=1 Tax=Lupinus luteus TaxID=3873 RepID=A0AAV1WA94_LUPLU